MVKSRTSTFLKFELRQTFKLTTSGRINCVEGEVLLMWQITVAPVKRNAKNFDKKKFVSHSSGVKFTSVSSIVVKCGFTYTMYDPFIASWK